MLPLNQQLLCLRYDDVAMPPGISRIKVNLPPRSYDVMIGGGLLPHFGSELRTLLGVTKSLFVVTVPPVRRKWGKKLLQSLTSAGFVARILEMPDGERNKRLSTVEGLAEKLIALGAERNAVIIAFGGGVVGDVAGMLASIYMRGVEVVQIPTTVLAQVDASIGGKTGVNLRTGKNLVGTFHQPRMVLIDPAILATLPEREFRAGIYESLKCGVIGNTELFHRLAETAPKKLRRDPDALKWVIEQSVKLKADVVSADEREGGLRRVLNFGHTIGHALESESGYKRFLHGEAIAWGMIAATFIAAETGLLNRQTAEKIIETILGLGPLPKVSAKSRTILRLLQTDKKTTDGAVHFVLPSKIGAVEVVKDVPERTIIAAVDKLKSLS